MVLDRIFEKIERKIFEPVRWFFTFNIINFLWLLFRSDTINMWIQLIKRIISFQDTSISQGLIDNFVMSESKFIQSIFHLDKFANNIRGFWLLVYLIISFFVCLIPENNYKNYKSLSFVSMIFSAILFIWAFICLSGESVFVYFNF